MSRIDPTTLKIILEFALIGIATLIALSVGASNPKKRKGGS